MENEREEKARHVFARSPRLERVQILNEEDNIRLLDDDPYLYKTRQRARMFFPFLALSFVFMTTSASSVRAHSCLAVECNRTTRQLEKLFVCYSLLFRIDGRIGRGAISACTKEKKKECVCEKEREN